MIAAEKPAHLLYGSGAVTTSYTFNPLGQVYHESVNNRAGGVIDLSYDYDALHRLHAIGSDANFAYTDHRLTSATIESFGNAAFGYDAAGNLTSKDGIAFTYNAHYPVSGSAGGQVVYAAVPDACGRTKTRTANGQTMQFEYDGMGCLQRVVSQGGTLREMLSDAF